MRLYNRENLVVYSLFKIVAIPHCLSLRRLMTRAYNIALVGNPNSGKSSLFNALTGLNQKVGNFPGVTVDKKTGKSRIADGLEANIIDLPGTYSLYPKSADEQVTYEVLLNSDNANRPDLVIVIADASNLKRNLLFCTQIMDLKIPIVIALTMLDIAGNKGISINIEELQRHIGVPVIPINPRKNKGISELKKAITDINKLSPPLRPDFVKLTVSDTEWMEEIRIISGQTGSYGALHIACNYTNLNYINAAQRIRIAALLGENGFHKSKVQAEEIILRYKKIDAMLQHCVVTENPAMKMIISDRIDKTLLHPVYDNLILLTVLFPLFQSIF
jgi:ferrous iron transport protein B